MKPFQLWIPLMGFNPNNPTELRDLVRAEAAWRGEDCVWLLPDWQESRTWTVERQVGGLRVPYRELGVRSETFNAYAVHEVDDQGCVWPPVGDCLPEDWDGKLPGELWRLWLNAKCELQLVGTEVPSIQVDVPHWGNGQVVYRSEKVRFRPGPVLPILATEEKDDRHMVKLSWPPKGFRQPLPVSPEQEILERYGEPAWDPEDSSVRCPGLSGQAIWFWPLWQEPFSRMFSKGANRLDLLYEQALMRYCVRLLEEGHREEALAQARARLNLYAREGKTTLERSWLFPAALKAHRQGANPQEELLWMAEARFGKHFGGIDRLQALLGHPEYPCLLGALELPVRRVIGWIGLFWLQFLAHLEAGGQVRRCERCGHVIAGRSHKRYCGRKDNLDCFRARQREDQRRSRGRRKPAAPERRLPRVT